MADFFSRFRRTPGSVGDPTASARAAASALPPAETGLGRWLARGEDETAAWNSARPGPTADQIATRISGVPKDFLEGDVDLVALAGDVLDDIFGRVVPGGPPSDQAAGVAGDAVRVLREIVSGPSDAARSAAAIALWIFASVDEFGPTSPPFGQYYAPRVIAALAWRLSDVVDPGEWLSDAERRDEAARTFLLWSGFLPGGEDLETARGLFAMRDSLQRNRAMADALAQQQHRLDVTRQLQEARAREAAARPSSE